MGEGIIEFARKPGAQMALRRCTEGCFFLTAYVICFGPYIANIKCVKVSACKGFVGGGGGIKVACCVIVTEIENILPNC